MVNALLITAVGMFAVYIFLLLLMYTVQFMSFCVQYSQKRANDPSKIAAVIGIALQREKDNGCS